MNEKIDKLDEAFLEYIENKQTLPDELHPYSKTLAKLEVLRDVPERDPDVEASARESFLQQIKSMPAPVSKSPKSRLIGWNIFSRRERSPMTTIVGFVLALVVAFGGAGTTAYAAQDSLPNEPLYPVKQLTEQIRVALTTDKEAEVYLYLDLAEERVGEMMALAKMGLDIPEKTQLSLQEHLQLALSETAQLGDAALLGTLQQIQTMAQNQINAMEQMQQNIPDDSPREELQIAISAMNRVRQEAEDGLMDPLSFRNRQGTNRPENAPEQPENVPPGTSNDSGSQSGEGATGKGYGDGTGEGGGAYGDGYGDGTGDGVCNCTCDDPNCDCATDCMSQGDGNGVCSCTCDDPNCDCATDCMSQGGGDEVCNCTCDDPNCDCATNCMSHNQHDGKMDSKEGKH